MIETFQKYTQELTEEQLSVLVPLLVSGLSPRKGKTNAITNSKARISLESKGYKVSAPCFRKIINHIRVNGLLPNLLSTSKGYYIATTYEEKALYLKSLRQRISSIKQVLEAIEQQPLKKVA